MTSTWLPGKREVFARIRIATFAIAWRPTLRVQSQETAELFFKELRIAGTGFFVRESGIALTALHVLKPWLDDWASYRRGMKAIPPQPPIVIFDSPIEAVGAIRRQHILAANITKIRGWTDFDIAAVQVSLGPGQSVNTTRLSDGDIHPGDPVALCGYPEGKSLHADLHGGFVLTCSFSEGIVSAVLPFSEAGPDYWRWLQVDALANPGNSGGPAFDPTTGEVGGVVIEGNIKKTRLLSAEGTPVELEQFIGLTRAFSTYHAKHLVESFAENKELEEHEVLVDWTAGRS